MCICIIHTHAEHAIHMHAYVLHNTYTRMHTYTHIHTSLPSAMSQNTAVAQRISGAIVSGMPTNHAIASGMPVGTTTRTKPKKMVAAVNAFVMAQNSSPRPSYAGHCLSAIVIVACRSVFLSCYLPRLCPCALVRLLILWQKEDGAPKQKSSERCNHIGNNESKTL
jgi:hypothetical protein